MNGGNNLISLATDFLPISSFFFKRNIYLSHLELLLSDLKNTSFSKGIGPNLRAKIPLSYPHVFKAITLTVFEIYCLFSNLKIKILEASATTSTHDEICKKLESHSH